MRIPEVFTYIYDNEENAKAKENKYRIIRTILVECLANKNDFRSVIENHDYIVVQVSKVLKQRDSVIDMHLVEIYNYPEIYETYSDLLKPYEIGCDDDESCNSLSDEDDETVCTNTTPNTPDVFKGCQCKVVSSEADKRVIRKTHIISLLTLSFSILNTVLLLKQTI
jgi:hypothetical protein